MVHQRIDISIQNALKLAYKQLDSKLFSEVIPQAPINKGKEGGMD
jgi:hypothetical protein